MKRQLAVALTVLMLLGSMSMAAFAETEPVSAEIYVTIANKGSLAVVREQITVSDRDGDGALNIDEALYATHEAKYEGGAAAGYATAVTDWGLGITKLWGDTSGNYGYYVNNASAWGLTDPVAAGDSLVAFVYADSEFYSDTYTWFDQTAVTTESGKDITLTLSGAGYDAEWNPITVPVEGATVTVNGEATAFKTDAEGKVTIQITEGGNHLISAVSEPQTLVPPVCLATISIAETAEVYVTVADKGILTVAQEKVTVSDHDKDGALTVNDALYAVHEAKYEGGAAAGYATAATEWGLSITKLWGDTSGNYGYYVNNASAWSLADPVEAGDYVNTFVYIDGEYYSDTYTWFTTAAVTAESGKDITLTLSGAGYDAEWNPVTVPVAGATITVNGEATAFKTDAEGKVTIQIAEAGQYVISAVSETQTLVPPVCLAKVTAAQEQPGPAEDDNDADQSGSKNENDADQSGPAENENKNESTGTDEKENNAKPSGSTSPDTGDHSNVYLYAALMMISLCGIAALVLLKKHVYEN